MINILDLKSKFVPVKKNGKQTIISFGLKPYYVDGNETELACWSMHTFTEKVPFNKIKSFILSRLNEQIDQKIINGFVWKEMPVWLSSENQFNYKTAYDLAVMSQGKSLPTVFKFGTTDNPVYYAFESLDDISDFYISAMAYINTCLAEGWKMKDSIDWSVYEKALE